MSEIEECRNYIDTLREEYKENQCRKQEREELISENNIEKRDIKGYHGREILELLQNADDAYQKSIEQGNRSKEKLCVSIFYKNNVLKIENTGTFFDKDGIKAIVQGNNSHKKGKYIGNKGTGFRSVLNWANTIKICSGNFNVVFSKEIASKIFNELKNEPQIKKQLEKQPNLYIPMLEVPENLESKCNDKTSIEIEIDEDKIRDDFSVQRQLEDIDVRILLFLPNTSQIHIVTDDKDILYKREISKDEFDFKNATLQKEESGNITAKEQFFLFEKTIPKALKEDDEFKDILLAIAIPQDFSSFEKSNLYTFFPLLDTESPFSCILHASYMLGDQRNTINSGAENKKVIGEQLKFLVETANKFIQYRMYDTAYEILVPVNFQETNWKFPTPFAKFNLEDFYLNLLLEQKIFLTVNDKNISVLDEPKTIDDDFPKVFTGEKFKKLLKPITDKKMLSLLDVLAERAEINIKYKESELLEIINALSDAWTIAQQVEVFIWWNSHYKSSLPNLLKDSNNNWISSNSKVYLPTETGITILPKELSWVKLCILRQDYCDELIKQIKEKQSEDWTSISAEYKNPGEKRVLAAFSDRNFLVKFTEQSSADLIVSTINQQVDSVKKSKTFFIWVYNRYKDSLQENTQLSSIKFKLPNRESEIKQINELYLGNDYGNPLAEKLFAETSATPLAPIEKIYDGDEKENFVTFLKRCGILQFPEIKKVSLTTWGENYAFTYFVHNNYATYLNRINYLRTFTIENFKNLISHLSTDEIKKWLTEDEKLRNYLFSSTNESEAQQQSNWSLHYFPSNAYLKYILNNTPWIELSGQKYAPNKIIKYEKLKDNIDGYYGISEQELTNRLGKDIEVNFQLDFKDSFTDFSDEEIKKILDSLPNFDKGEISRKIYADIIKNKQGKMPSYSTQDLKVLTKDGLFHPNDEVMYADKKIQNENKSKFIWIQPKQSIETIKNWLGVERYKTTLILKDFVQNDSFFRDFQSEIDDIKVSILCTIDANEANSDKIKQMKIVPCKKVEVIDTERDKKDFFLGDYFFVKAENAFYLKLPSDIDIQNLRKSDAFSVAIVDIFTQPLPLTLDSSLIELLVSKDKKSKKSKIEDLYGVDSWANSYNLLFDKNFTNESIYKFFSTNKLNHDLYKKISEIDFTSELSDSNCEILVNALKSISKDVKNLNSVSELINIDIRSYFKNQLRKNMDLRFKDYKTNLYFELSKSENETKQAKFLEMINEYKNYDTSKIELKNSVNEDLGSILKKQFSILSESFSETVDIDKIYSENVSKILKKLNLDITDFDFYIQNHPKQNSLLYFKIPENIYADISAFLPEENEQKENINPTNIETPKISTKTIRTELEGRFVADNFFSASKSKTERSQHEYEARYSANEKAGKNAEEIAYLELSKQYPNLIWHSKNSNRIADRNNPPPNGIVCDMWNYDSENGNSYFEVKSATDEFEMSIQEYESMKDNQENYEVVLVNRDTNEISRHKFAELDELKQVNEYKFLFTQKCI